MIIINLMIQHVREIMREKVARRNRSMQAVAAAEQVFMAKADREMNTKVILGGKWGQKAEVAAVHQLPTRDGQMAVREC